MTDQTSRQSPAVSDVDDDELLEALSDAASDGEGRITPYYLHHHLAKHGYKIVRAVESGDRGED